MNWLIGYIVTVYLCYIVTMSWVQCRAAHCDVCGHEWLASGQPKQCAKCKTRAWNSAGQAIACAVAVNEAIYDAIERLPARPKPRTKGPTVEQFAAMKPSERLRAMREA